MKLSKLHMHGWKKKQHAFDVTYLDLLEYSLSIQFISVDGGIVCIKQSILRNHFSILDLWIASLSQDIWNLDNANDAFDTSFY